MLNEHTHFVIHFHVKYHTWVTRDSVVQQDSVQDGSQRVYVCCLSVWLASLMTVTSLPLQDWVQDSCHCLIYLTEREYCCEP